MSQAPKKRPPNCQPWKMKSIRSYLMGWSQIPWDGTLHLRRDGRLLVTKIIARNTRLRASRRGHNYGFSGTR